MGQGLIDEQMARRATNHLQHLGVGQAFFVEPLDQSFTGALGGHANAAAQHIVLLTSHQRSPSSQPSSVRKASLKVRSSCNGVIET
ncbi:hypothetical protein D3C76_1612250 [compost metagenome]